MNIKSIDELIKILEEAAKRPRGSGYGLDVSDVDWDRVEEKVFGDQPDDSGDEGAGNVEQVWAYQDVTYRCNDCGRSWISKALAYNPTAVPVEPCPFCDRARLMRERTRLQIELTNQRLKPEAIPPQLPDGERFVYAEQTDGTIYYITFFSNIYGRAFTKVEIPLSLMIAEGQRNGWSHIYHWMRGVVFTRMVKGGQVILLNK